MDIQLKKRPFIIRYKYYCIAAALMLAFAGYATYVIMGPQKRSVSERQLGLATVQETQFAEYIEQDGLVSPLTTIKVNSRISGYVTRIVAEDGALLRRGDTILVLDNPELSDQIDEQEEALQKQLLNYTEQDIEMQQKSILLRKQVLQNQYELRRIAEAYKLAREEAEMGIKSKAELELAQQEYEYKQRTTLLEQENLRHDSASAVLRMRLIKANREQDIRKVERIRAKRDELVLRAPIDGQLSGLDVVIGQQLSANNAIAELKVPDQYKITIRPGEYYVGRLQAGQPASATLRGKEYAMRVRHVVPEVKEHTFQVDLVFSDSVPTELRLGQSLRVKVQLGGNEPALVIPRGNMMSHTGGDWIFRVVPGERRAVRVPIRLGRQNPRMFEILEGLQPGDQVVTGGYNEYGEAEEITW